MNFDLIKNSLVMLFEITVLSSWNNIFTHPVLATFKQFKNVLSFAYVIEYLFELLQGN